MAKMKIVDGGLSVVQNYPFACTAAFSSFFTLLVFKALGPFSPLLSFIALCILVVLITLAQTGGRIVEETQKTNNRWHCCCSESIHREKARGRGHKRMSDWIQLLEGRTRSISHSAELNHENLELDLSDEAGGMAKNEDLCYNSVSRWEKSVILESCRIILDKIVTELLRSARSAQENQNLQLGIQRKKRRKGKAGSIYKSVVQEFPLVYEKGTACGSKAIAMVENQIDKYQIHPLESISETQEVFRNLSDKTDEELQVASADFYTLEGQILWQDTASSRNEKTDSAMEEKGLKEDRAFGASASSDNDEVQDITVICCQKRSRRDSSRKIKEDVENNLFTSSNTTYQPAAGSRILLNEYKRTALCHHSQRSSLLNAHPISSPETSIRQQEMDLLWEESDKGRKEHVMRENTRNQTQFMMNDGQQEFDTSMNIDKLEIKMGIKSSTEIGCWHFRGRRAAKKSFFSFCRAWKDFGLKQCLQGSKVSF